MMGLLLRQLLAASRAILEFVCRNVMGSAQRCCGTVPFVAPCADGS